LPPLRGGGYCRDACWAIVIIVILIVVGFITFSAGAAVYGNDNSNTAARNALIAVGIILILGILGCLLAVCQACQDSCDFCCKCHLVYR
jgi:hypothetical protein